MTPYGAETPHGVFYTVIRKKPKEGAYERQSHSGYSDRMVAGNQSRDSHISGKKHFKGGTKVSVRELILRDKILTEKELHEIMNAYGMTEPGISGKELLV